MATLRIRLNRSKNASVDNRELRSRGLRHYFSLLRRPAIADQAETFVEQTLGEYLADTLGRPLHDQSDESDVGGRRAHMVQMGVEGRPLEFTADPSSLASADKVLVSSAPGENVRPLRRGRRRVPNRT